MWTSNDFARVLLVLVTAVAFSPSALAAEVTGAWASDASVCSKVFVKKDNKLSFTPDAELYGSSLLVEGNRVSGTLQKCTIKSMKREGADIHLIAACSSGVMVSDFQFTVKMVGDNQITVSQAGPVSMETPYVRCPL